jgi:hypothetical protein
MKIQELLLIKKHFMKTIYQNHKKLWVLEGIPYFKKQEISLIGMKMIWNWKVDHKQKDLKHFMFKKIQNHKTLFKTK